MRVTYNDQFYISALVSKFHPVMVAVKAAVLTDPAVNPAASIFLATQSQENYQNTGYTVSTSVSYTMHSTDGVTPIDMAIKFIFDLNILNFPRFVIKLEGGADGGPMKPSSMFEGQMDEITVNRLNRLIQLMIDHGFTWDTAAGVSFIVENTAELRSSMSTQYNTH